MKKLINNHLCNGCDRIIGGGNRVCRACIKKAVKKVVRERKEKTNKAHNTPKKRLYYSLLRGWGDWMGNYGVYNRPTYCR